MNKYFTLVEMLVVIAIIVILSSLLLPGLVRAANQAKSVLCGNNMKGMHSAYQMYIDDNHGWFPPYYVDQYYGLMPDNYIASYLGISGTLTLTTNYYCLRDLTRTDDNGACDIFRCPLGIGRVNAANAEVCHFYETNAYLTITKDNSDRYYQQKRASQIKCGSAKAIVFFDLYSCSPGVREGSAVKISPYNGHVYSEGRNIIFLDGHLIFGPSGVYDKLPDMYGIADEYRRPPYSG